MTKSAAEDVEFESAFGEVLVYFILAQLLAPAQQCRLCVQLPCLPLDELGNHWRREWAPSTCGTQWGRDACQSQA